MKIRIWCWLPNSNHSKFEQLNFYGALCNAHHWHKTHFYTSTKWWHHFSYLKKIVTWYALTKLIFWSCLSHLSPHNQQDSTQSRTSNCWKWFYDLLSFANLVKSRCFSIHWSHTHGHRTLVINGGDFVTTH